MSGQVVIEALLQGFNETKSGLEQLTKSMDNVSASADKMNKAGSAGSKGVNETAKSSAAATEELAGLARIGTGAAAVLGGVLAAGAIYAGKELLGAVNHVRDLGEQLHNMSQITGFSVEKLGGLQLAAATNNLSLDQLTNGLTRFNKNIAEAAKGSGQSADAFDRMGISIRDGEGNLKSTDLLLGEVADKFASYKDGAEKVALATALFNMQGGKMIPLLNEGSEGMRKLREEAEKAGIVMSAETAEAANKLNSNMTVLKAHAQGFWSEIASPIVESLARITTAMRDAKREGDSWWGSFLEGARKGMQEMAGFGSEAQEMRTLASALGDLARQRQGAEARGDTGMLGSIDAQIAFYQQRVIQLRALEALSGPGSVTGDKPNAPEPRKFKDGANNAVIDEIIRAEKDLARRHEEIQEARRKAGEARVKEEEAQQKAINDKRFADIAEIARQERLFHEAYERALKNEALFEEENLATRVRGWNETTAAAQRALLVADEYNSIMGKAAVDTNRVFAGFAGAVQSVMGELLRGHVHLSDQIHRIWKGLVNSMIDEFARVMTRAMLEPIFEPFKDTFKKVGEFVRDNVFSPLWDFIKSGFMSLFQWLTGINWGSAFNFSGLAGIFGGNALAGGAAGAGAAAGGGALGGGLFGGGAGIGSIGNGVSLGGLAGLALPLAAMAPGILGVLGGHAQAPYDWASQLRTFPGGASIDFRGVNPEVSARAVTAILGEIYGNESMAGPGEISQERVNEIARGHGIPGYGMGTDMFVTKPTLFMAGEGPEQVTVTPVGGAQRGRSGGVTVVVNGPMVGDYFSTQKFMRDLERWADRHG